MFDELKEVRYFNPIQDAAGRQKGPPTSFSSVTFTNVGINPQNFLTETGVKFQVCT